MNVFGVNESQREPLSSTLTLKTTSKQGAFTLILVYMASVEELDHQVDSGMGSSDARSPEVKSLLPDDEDDDEEVRARAPLQYKKDDHSYDNLVFGAPGSWRGLCHDVCKMQDVLEDR